jgi:hypothetical protein
VRITSIPASRLLLGSRLSRSLLLGVITALVVVAVPAAAQAATPSKDTLQANGAHHAVPAARLSSFCSKVSASAVSAIVGYKVPAGVFGTFKIKPAKENYETSGTDTTCTYGAETSMATIVKSVTLSFETVSKALTPAEMQQSLAKASAITKFKFSTYSGLGVPAFYFSVSEAGITGQGISAEVTGTTYIGATVESKSFSKSTIASLVKLAEKL